MYDKTIQYIPNWVYMYDFNHTNCKIKKNYKLSNELLIFLQTILTTE